MNSNSLNTIVKIRFCGSICSRYHHFALGLSSIFNIVARMNALHLCKTRHIIFMMLHCITIILQLKKLFLFTQLRKYTYCKCVFLFTTWS